MIDTAIADTLNSDPSDLVEGGLSIISFFQLAVAMLLMGLTAGWLQRWMLAERRVGASLWLGAVAAVVVASLLILLSIPVSAARFLTEHLSVLSEGWAAGAVRLSALLLVVAAGLLFSAGWWDRRHVMGARRAVREMFPLLPAVAVAFVAGWLLLVLWPQEPGVGPVPTHHPAWMRGPLTLVLFLTGFNAGGLARALANRGLGRFAGLVIVAPPTVGLVALNFWLFTLSLKNCGTNWVAGQVLLGSEMTDTLSLTRTLGRWAIGYFMVVVLMGVGGCIGIRLAPTPRIRRTGWSSDGRLIVSPMVPGPSGASPESVTPASPPSDSPPPASAARS